MRADNMRGWHDLSDGSSRLGDVSDLFPHQGPAARNHTNTTATSDDTPLARLLGLIDSARPAWQREAACRGVGTDVFFATHGGDTNYTEARAYCAVCPVVDECRAYNDSFVGVDGGHYHGVWGGETRNEREIRRAGEGDEFGPCSGCGQVKTRVGRYGRPVRCEACLREAHREANRAYVARKRGAA